MTIRIAKGTIYVLTFLLVANIYGTVCLQEQSDTASISQSGECSKNDIIKILGIDPTAYPDVKVNIFIDTFSAMAGDLDKEDFKVEEDGNEVAIDNLYFTGNASGQKLDLAVVFDNTYSMRPRIDAMKSKTKNLTDSLNAVGIDASYSLVSFGNDVSVRTGWTDDPAAFKREVDALTVISGIDEPENPLDAIETVLSMGFRPDAQKVVLVITDDYAHHKDDGSGISNYTKEEVTADLKESGVILVVVSPELEGSKDFVDMRDVAEDTSSVWIDIESGDFSAVLEQFKGMLTGAYVIEYKSPATEPATTRTISVSVNASGCLGCEAMSSYNAPESRMDPDESAVISPPTADNTSSQKEGVVINGTPKDAKTEDAEAWVNIGIALNIQGKYDEGIQAYDEAIKINPDYASAWEWKGLAFNYQGKYEEAIQAFEKAIRLDPGSTKAWVAKGLAYYGLGRYDEAIQAYDEAIRIDPRSILAWECKGIALLKEKRYDEAILAYGEVVQIDPDRISKVGPMLAKAWAGKALSLYNQGNYDKAMMACDEAIRHDPDNFEAWGTKSLVLLSEGKYDEAVQSVDEVIRLNPNIDAIWASKGRSLEALGRTSEANNAYSRARELGWTG